MTGGAACLLVCALAALLSITEYTVLRAVLLPALALGCMIKQVQPVACQVGMFLPHTYRSKVDLDQKMMQ